MQLLLEAGADVGAVAALEDQTYRVGAKMYKTGGGTAVLACAELGRASILRYRFLGGGWVER